MIMVGTPSAAMPFDDEIIFALNVMLARSENRSESLKLNWGGGGDDDYHVGLDAGENEEGGEEDRKPSQVLRLTKTRRVDWSLILSLLSLLAKLIFVCLTTWLRESIPTFQVG